MKKLKKIKTTILTIVLSMMFTMPVFAQDHDNSKSPHGGKVEEAGDFHIEALIKDGKVYFYLLDGKAKSFSNIGVTGTVLIQFKDGKTKTIKLTSFGKDGFWANDAEAKNYTKAIVTFIVKGKTASATFSTKTEDHNHNDGEHHHDH